MLLAACGAIVLTRVEPTSSPLMVVGAWAIVNLGVAPLVSLATGLVVGAVPPEKAGSAAAISETSGEFAYAFGLAVLGSLGGAVYRWQIGTSAPLEARESIVGAMAAAASLPDVFAAPLMLAAREAFAVAFQSVAAASALTFVVVAILALSQLRHVRPLGA
jgi:DHA2 family multidrug resistance protein-like MFS transporter